jgi:alginate O-acetyltransferase complex protein AlgI
MSFNSWEFYFFITIFLFFYSIFLKKELQRNILFLVGSYVFYMSWNWKYAGLIAFSTLLDYFIGRVLNITTDKNKRKLLLITSVCVNLGLLCIFKYYNFFIDAGSELVSFFGFKLPSFHHQLLLPVGISFYTFQTLSYTIDLYRKKIPCEKDLIKYSIYVSFFPQLVAGPIVRAADLLPQLNRKPKVSPERVKNGIFLVFKGLLKKIVLADLLAGLAVDRVFVTPSEFSSIDLLVALYAYTFQIYYDFSGYSDIAIGLGSMLGFNIPQNFNRPYLSKSIREFWTRWHISLSKWIRDYLYVSLGGNRVSPIRMKINLMITMLLAGLWHGAAYNFVLWGGYHGVLLISERLGYKIFPIFSYRNDVIKQIKCFHLVVFGWLLFRVQDMETFLQYINGILKIEIGSVFHPFFYFILFCSIIFHLFPKRLISKLQHLIIQQNSFVQATLYSLLLIFFSGMTLGAPNFIYFQF